MSETNPNLDIESCIKILQELVVDTNQLFELPEAQRIALYKLAGELSRPNRDEFQRRRKDAKKAVKRKMIAKDTHARKTTGIRSARESALFVAPKLLTATLKPSETLELESPRNCYICKTVYTKLHHFYDTMCTNCGDLNYIKRFQTTNLKDQVAVITGSRLKIGYHITLMLLRSGATVVATTRFPADSAIRFSKEDDYNQWSDRLHIHGLDLRHIPSVEIFCNYIEQKYDRLDILINNAAIFSAAPIAEITRVDYAKIFDTNVSGCLFTLQAVAKHMIARGIKGRIINLASQAGRRGEPLVAVYCASKAAVISLTQSAGLNLIEHGINVNAIAPGLFPSNMTAYLMEDEEALNKNIPMNRMGKLEDAAGTVIYLCSRASSYMTGGLLVIDGGSVISAG